MKKKIANPTKIQLKKTIVTLLQSTEKEQVMGGSIYTSPPPFPLAIPTQTKPAISSMCP